MPGKDESRKKNNSSFSKDRGNNRDKNKFAENEEHFGDIINKVDGMLFGLFW